MANMTSERCANNYGENIPLAPRKKGSEEVKDDKSNGHPMAGLGVCMASMFVVGDMAGAGLLSLPKALDKSGSAGFAIITVSGLLMAYTARALSMSLSLVRQRHAEYRGHLRYPYALIGQVTFGSRGRYLVSSTLIFTNYGAFLILLMIVTDNIHQWLVDVGLNLEFDYCLPATAIIALPILWFGTPKDFWLVGIVTASTTFASTLLIFVNITYDGVKQSNTTVEHTHTTWLDLGTALGTIWFSFGGHAAFPTIQVDMGDPVKFDYSVLLAFMWVFVIYLPITVGGYFVYGVNTADSILTNLSRGPMLVVIQILMTVHFLLALVIVVNPVFQEIEDFLGVPKDFNWKRCLSRTCLVTLAVLNGILVPNFSTVMSLVGGSTMVLLITVFPIGFRLKLVTMEGDWKKMSVSVLWTISQCVILVLAVFVSVVCTSTTIYTMVHLETSETLNKINSTAVLTKIRLT